MTKKEITEIENYEYLKCNNITCVEIEDGKRATLKGEITKTSMNPYNIVHGGYLFGLGDTAMGLVAYSCGGNVVTVSSTINYIRPAIGKYLLAKAEMVKKGKTISNLKVDIYNDKDELVASMTGVYYYI